MPPSEDITINEADLLERLRQGDEAAFDTIFRAWYASLVRFAESLVKRRAVAEEIVDDVMLELWRRREALSAEGSAKAYLIRSTRNRALNELRHEKVTQAAEPELSRGGVSHPTGLARLEERELDGAVRAAIASLPPRCREVFELSRVHGLKYQEIASTLGVSVKAVEAQMGKALRMLRTRLAPWLPRVRATPDASGAL